MEKLNSVKNKVSIIIITYNQVNFVTDAIESAVKQEYVNLEIIVSDDGSTDGTAELVKKFEKKYPERIVALINKNNVGITKNCNRALRVCTGEFIAFQGGDDVLLPGKIKTQVEWFQCNSNRVLCGHQTEVFYEDNSKLPHLGRIKLREGYGPLYLLKNGVPFGGTSIMIRTNSVPSDGFNENIPSASDYLFWLEILSKGGEYGYVDGVFARARRHSANVTNRVLEMSNDVELTYEIFSKKYPEYKMECIDAYIRNVLYYRGVLLLKCGEKTEARSHFLKTIIRKPL